MRDRSSSYWFSVGDRVTVVGDVWTGGGSTAAASATNDKNHTNLKGRIGTVVETWEKCDVDPTCCCAEQVDTDMAVRVLFNDDDDDGGGGTETDNEKKETAAGAASSFYYYFAEDELDKL